VIVLVSMYSFGFYYKNNHEYFEGNVESIKRVVTEIIRRIGFTTIRELKLATNVHSYNPPVFQDFTTYAPRYVFDVLKAYFLIQFLFLGLISIRKINLNLLMIVMMSAPYFVFLIYPAINLDNPWMMRKYWIVFIPLVYILFGFFLKNNDFGKRTKILIIFLLFIIQLYLSSPVISFAENRGLIDSLEKLVKKMPNADLVITTKSTNAGWYYPLWIYYGIPSQMQYFNKNFQNKQNFENMISKFNNVFLLTASWTDNDQAIIYENFSYPDTGITKIGQITIPVAEHLVIGKELWTAKEYDYDFLKNIIDRIPPKKIINYEFEVIILKLQY